MVIRDWDSSGVKMPTGRGQRANRRPVSPCPQKALSVSPPSAHTSQGDVLENREKSALEPARAQKFKQGISLTPDSRKEDLLEVHFYVTPPSRK